MKRFVVLSTQRTGSTLLISSLDSHPGIFCAGEIFFPRSGSEYAINRYARLSSLNRVQHTFCRGRLVRRFLDEFYERTGYAAIGFKYMYSQARHIPRRYPSALKYLHEHSIPVIHNVRQNKLRVLLSRISARSSGVYRSDRPVGLGPVNVPLGHLLEELRQLERADETWKRRMSGHDYLQVSYESFVGNQADQVRSILDFLDIEDAHELNSPFVKVSSRTIEETVQNYDELSRTLAGTEFEWCLHREIR